MLKKFLLLFHLCLLPLSCFGWWDAGHMAVAKIAYEQLEPDVKKTVDRLAYEFAPFFPESPDFITAACWPDDLSHEGIKAFYDWHGCALPYDPECLLSEEQKEKIMLNFKGHDIVWAINQCVSTLQNPESSEWAKAFMLRFLLHIVGDVHQPLHCATLYSSTFPKGDKAGTRYEVSWEGQEKCHLHSYWDGMCGLGTARLERPLTDEGEKYLEALVHTVTSLYPEENLVEELRIENPKDWHQESYQLAYQVVYQGISPGETPSESYTAIGQETCAKRIALAGYRLSRLLNRSVNASSSLSRP